MLMVGLTLPVLDDVIPEYVLYLVTDLNLCPITNQFGHGSSSPDVILEDMDKLLICLHWVDIAHHGFSTNKELCCNDSTVNSWGVRVHCICCYWLISMVNVACWKWQFVPLLEVDPHGHLIVLRC